MALDPKTLAEMDAALGGSSVDIDAMDAVLNAPQPIANPMGDMATPAQVIRNAAMGRIDRKAAEDYLRSVALDPASIDNFGKNAPAGDVALGLMQAPAKGLTMGFGEEAASAVAALPALLPGGLGYNEARQSIQEDMRRTQDIAAIRQPIANFAAELGGSVAGAVGAARNLPTLTQGLSNIAKRGIFPAAAVGAGTGAVSAGLYGAGTSEQNRGQAAMDAAPYGAVFGAAIPAATAVARPLTERASRIFSRFNALKAPKATIAATTMREIAEASDMQAPDTVSEIMLNKVGKTIRNEFGDAMPAVAQALKQEGTAIIDTNNAKVRQLAKGAAQYAGGQEVAEKFFTERLAKSPDEIMRSISKNISSVNAYHATVDDLLKAGQAKARPLYDKAYTQIVPDNTVTKQLYQMPEISKALDRAYAEFPSELQGVARNSIKALDYAKRIIDDDINKAQGDRASNFIRSRTMIKNQLLEAMDAASPTYREARKVSGDYLSINNAMESGRDFMKQDAELLSKQFKALPEAEKSAFKVGVAKELQDVTNKVREGINPYNRILGSPENQRRLAAILSPEQYKNFAEDLRAQDRMFKLRNEILGGSPNTSKQVAAKEIAELGSFITANPQMGIMQAVQGYMRKAFDGLNDKTARQVAEIIFEERPAQKLKLLDEITKGKAITRQERQAVKEAYVKIERAFDEIKAAQSVTGGIVGAKVNEENR